MADPRAGRVHQATADRPVLVVGAGMAGLACAVSLHEAGVPVRVLEAASEVGGRIRTQRHPDGYLLDRGFQVLLEGYPYPRRLVDYDQIGCRPFDSGALVWTGRRLVPLGNPFIHPGDTVRDVTSPVFGFADKVRLARLGLEAWRTPWRSAREAAEPPNSESAAEALWGRGFSSAFVDRFARGFWGGILLDPTLETSAGPLLFTLKMFLEGRALLPRDGVGAMPAAIARRLPEGTITFGARVAEVVRDGEAAIGVRVGDETILGSAVVVAADPPTARALTGIATLPSAEDGLGSLTVYLVSDRDPGLGQRLAIDGTRRCTVNHVAPLSAVQSSYAPEGRHLVAGVVVGDRLADGDDATLARRVRRDVAAMLNQPEEAWEIVLALRVPFSQFAQPPGIYDRLPGNETETDRLFLASEATVDSSYNGATASGEAAARAVARRLAGRLA